MSAEIIITLIQASLLLLLVPNRSLRDLEHHSSISTGWLLNNNLSNSLSNKLCLSIKPDLKSKA
jgi:hypothetical protein